MSEVVSRWMDPVTFTLEASQKNGDLRCGRCSEHYQPVMGVDGQPVFGDKKLAFAEGATTVEVDLWVQCSCGQRVFRMWAEKGIRGSRGVRAAFNSADGG